MELDKRLYERIKAKIELEEGRESKMYRCPAGYNTIGIGHNLDANGIGDKAIDAIFEEDLEKVVKELDKKLAWWRDAPDNVQRVLVDLTFNMGMPRLLKFKNTLRLIKNRDYKKSSYALLKSLYAKQVRNRANRNAVLLRGVESENRDEIL